MLTSSAVNTPRYPIPTGIKLNHTTANSFSSLLDVSVVVFLASVPLLLASTPVFVSNASEVAYLKLAKYIHSFPLSTAKLVSEAATTAVYFRNVSDQTNRGLQTCIRYSPQARV